MEHDEFMRGLENAIEGALHIDEDGDYNLNIADVADRVVDYLEQQGILIFTNNN